MKKITSLSAILLCTVWIAYGQWTYNYLSEPKNTMGYVSLGNKAYIAGGTNSTSSLTVVEVCDDNSGLYSYFGDLSVARGNIAGVACRTKLFFAGGAIFPEAGMTTVDIYDTVSGQWTVDQLSQGRFLISTASDGNKVLFAGGFIDYYLVGSQVVDIYDIQTGAWSIINLSEPRGGMASASVGDIAVFAGGIIDQMLPFSDQVDIYNFTSNTWITATLSQPRAFAEAAIVGHKVIIAGGISSFGVPSDVVDIYDVSTGEWSTASLFAPRAMARAATVGGKAYFAGGATFNFGWSDYSNVIDVYDPATGEWSVDFMAEPKIVASITGLGDYLIIAGGEREDGMTDLVEIYHHPTLIHVPGEYSTIQEGINAASYNDTVLVAGGTYYENINFIGKPILVASEFIMNGDTNHINNTIIDGSQPVNPDFGSVVTFGSGEDTTSVLCGFTITGGTGTLLAVAGNARLGGGIMFGSGGKLINNHIEDNNLSNEGWASGGGIFAGGPLDPMPWVVLHENRITHNTVISSNDQGTGGGIEIWFNLVMVDNQISYNEANGAFRGDGGGARLSGNFGHIDLNMRNNLITHNKAVSNSEITDLVISGGLDIFWDCSGTISNNVISFNEIEVANEKWGYGTGVLIEAIDDQEFIFENNLVTDNTFTTGICMGGGLLIYDATGKYQNNVVQNNYGTYGGGVGIGSFNTENQPVLINNTITGNVGTNGGGLYISETNAIVFNTIIWGNTAPEGASIYQEASTLEVRYSDVQGDVVWPGEGNINEAPQFQADGYHLDEPGGLLNAGATEITISGITYVCPPFDIDGDMRPWANTQPEIGVDEVPDVSIGEPISANDLSINVYPNPADQMVTISLKNGAAIKEVSIFNQVGQNVFRGIPDENILDISRLQPGVYLLEVIADQSEFREKLIIE
jgi:hypothetical protein